MVIGITLEEKIIEKHSIEKYIDFLIDLSIDFVEIAPDFINYNIDYYVQIISILTTNNINIHYHLPHFVDDYLDITNFDRNQKDKLERFIKKLKTIHLGEGKSNLIIHGAKYEEIKKEEALTKTKNAVDYILKIIDRENMNFNILLETLNGNKHHVIGDNRKDLVEIIKSFNSNISGICWDVTHDFLNLGFFKKPDSSFKHLIKHIHIHGFDEIDHLSLTESKIDFKDQLKFIKSHMNTIPVNIELLYQNKYLSKIKKSKNYIEKC